MKKLIMSLVVGAMLTGAAWAGSLDMDDVGADAKWLVHVDTALIQETALGAEVYDGALGKLLQVVEQNPGQGFEKVLEHVESFLKVQNVTAYGNGDPKAGGVVLVDTGSDLDSLVKKAEKRVTVTEDEHAGHRLITLSVKQRPEKVFAAAAEDGRLVLSNKLANVQAALDVLDDQLPNAVDSDFFADGIPKDAVVTVAANNPPRANHVERMNLKVAEVDDKASCTIELNTKSEEHALQMNQVVNGVVAMAALQAEKSPILADLAKKVSSKSEGKKVLIEAACPNEDILNIILPLAKAAGINM